MNDRAPPRGSKELRASLVDAGWSPVPPKPEAGADPSARSLPRYPTFEALLSEPTQVDKQLDARVTGMRASERPATASHAPLPPSARPPPPSSRGTGGTHPPTRPPVPSAPPARAPVTSAPPARAPSASAAPRAPVTSAPPARPAAAFPALDARERPAQASSVAPLRAPELEHSASEPALRQAVTVVKPRSSFAPATLSFAGALLQRVRFAGGEVPLWSLITPLVLIVALGAAFAAAAVAAAAAPLAAPAPSRSAEPLGARVPIPEPPASIAPVPSPEASSKPPSLMELVESGDEPSLKAMSARPARELSAGEAIALSVGERARSVKAAEELRDRLAHDPGLIKDPNVLLSLRRFTDDADTAREALAAMSEIPGPISADLIYEVWTSSPRRSTATELARALIQSKDLRAKASPALGVALDLRSAETCEQAKDLLPKAIDTGDKRSFILLAKLTRRYGCGPNKRQDCYPCLRDDNKTLDTALKAVKTRREPRPFSG